MTKQDLKTGMLVQCANGNVYLLVNDSFVRENGIAPTYRFNDRLGCPDNTDFNIVKVSEIVEGVKLRPIHWTAETVDKYLLWSRDSGFVVNKTSDKPPRKEWFDIESGTWTETN